MTAKLTLNLQPEYLQQLQTILQEIAPECDVWAYGSRVHGCSHDASDLDLVLYQQHQPDEPFDALLLLREALINSRLPILVQVMDWARIPLSFREEIGRGFVVIQTGDASIHSGMTACSSR